MASEEERFIVLAVDDERDIRDLLSQFLGEAGFRVLVARSGNEALRQIKAHRPQLVLLDIILPDLDGMSVYETLAADPKCSKIPIIFFSALSQTLIEKKFSRKVPKGSFAFMPKPIQNEMLVKKVKEMLQL